MRKLLLGIIALIAVQFAFVTYMMVLQSPVELTNLRVQTKPGSLKPNLVGINDLNNSADVVPEQKAVVSPLEPRQTTMRPLAADVPARIVKLGRPAVGLVSKPTFDVAPSKAAAAGEFRSVVIRYNRNPDTLGCETPDIPKSKKRSFIAKAGPVIKKPWEWLKTVGSKLN